MSMVVICGDPGKGKTALLSYFQVLDCDNNGLENYINCKREIKKLKSGGFTALEAPPQKHVCFSDYHFRISKWCQSYYVSGFEIGLSNPFYNTILLPPYASIFLDEAQKYYDSRMSRYLREEVYRWFQLHRHNHYKIYMTCQRLGNIDLNIRAIADKYIVVEDMQVKKDEYNQVTDIKWITREFTSCDTAERYLLAKESKEISSLGKEVVYKTDLPIFDYYDSFGCKPVFYDQKYVTEVLTFDYYTEEGYEFTADSFADYNNTHYFVAPTGYLKNAKYDEKILEGLGGS